MVRHGETSEIGIGMIIKLKFDNVGGFYHVDVFAGNNLEALGKVGELIFRVEEWEAFKYLLKTGEEVQTLDNPTYTTVLIEEKTDV